MQNQICAVQYLLKQQAELRYICDPFFNAVPVSRHYTTRNHWSIENQLHWQLDVSFREDDARARRANSSLNLNTLRKQALSLLNLAGFGKRVSVRQKMSRAAMDNVILQSVVFPKK